MAMKKGRFCIIHLAEGIWTVKDAEHKIGHPLFSTRNEARDYLAGHYGLTWEEYRRWKG